MPLPCCRPPDRLTGRALRNARLCERALLRAETAPPLARAVVRVRAGALKMTRLELARRSGINRGTLRDLELGIHRPTRGVLRRFLAFCQKRKEVRPEQLEELYRLYAGPGDTLAQLIAHLELRAGSARELARRVGISVTTLWEYRCGNFPLPLDLLQRLCRAVDHDTAPAEVLWHQAERQRLLERGYPEALAEFWLLCTRQGYAEKHLLGQGLATAILRRLRYLELPPWQAVAEVAQRLCRDEHEFLNLQRLWLRDEQGQQNKQQDDFGARLKQLRKQQGLSRRELADLFGVGGKKPARIIKYIEEDGFYSAQAYPGGLIAVLTNGDPAQAGLREIWQERRQQFYRRRRPEMRVDLRLARELYGFRPQDMEPILGYPNLEYQRIERGLTPLTETARARILQAIHRAGQGRVEALLQQRRSAEAERAAWQAPPSVAAMIDLLAKREGGLVPLARQLRGAGVRGLWPGRLRAIAQGQEVPPWHLLGQIGQACGIADLSEVQQNWRDGYRAQLQHASRSPLGVEVRLLIAEAAATPRALSPKLGFNYSVLIRDLQRFDRDEPGKWFHIERILRAAGLPEGGERWKEIHALWYTAGERRKANKRPLRQRLKA